MRRPKTVVLTVVVGVAAAIFLGRQLATHLGTWTSGLPTTEQPGDTPLASLTIDYPADGSVFPPDMTAPLFSWHDASQDSTVWHIDVVCADGSANIHAKSSGPPPQVGEIDLRCVSVNNELPELLPTETTAHTWRPDKRTWAAIQRHSVDRPATVRITGFAKMNRPVSRGSIAIQVSKDPVGAPIFYRDVPLMPAETTPGIIRPLAEAAQPLIAWRLRTVAEPRSRLLLRDMPTCANCHSFSRDGKTLGMDLDGPENDKAI